MAKNPQPRYYASRKAWYVCIHGKQIPLAKGKGAKAEAWAKFHRMMAVGDVPQKRQTDVSVATLADIFLEDCQQRLEPLTYEWYLRHLQSFVLKYGRAKAEDIRPLHVSRWLAAHKTWAPSTQHGAITAVKRLIRWGKKQGYLAVDALEGVQRPGIKQREVEINREQYARLLAAVADDDAFRDFLEMLWLTGMRPSEAMRLAVPHIDFETRLIQMKGKTTGRTKKPRVIVMSDRLVEICRRLAELYPEGPILRNTQGRPWTRNATALRFARLRPKVGMGSDLTAESFRHGYATDALQRGVPVATVAALLGHQNTRTLDRHYSHLHGRLEHLRNAADQVRPPADEDASGPPVDPSA